MAETLARRRCFVNPDAFASRAGYRQPMQAQGRVLIIAGSDSGGGAGVQADIKTVTALGGYAATAITAITVQNTLGVTGVHPIPHDIIAAQARAVLSDIGADAIKTGMLGDAATVELVAALLDEAGVAAVIDPVMVAKGGASLLAAEAVAAVRAQLIPRAALLTPNAPEAEVLTGISVATPDDLRRAGEALLATGAKAVLMKGGHVPGERVVDILMTPPARPRSRASGSTAATPTAPAAPWPRPAPRAWRQGLPLTAAVARAWDYVHEAILRAPGLGAGHGPLDHGWPLRGRA
jgi:hydroxymethylpyrimidine/phosphomethylpyrimidine kinase